MFKRLREAEAAVMQASISISLNGRNVPCRPGDSVAAACFAAGDDACRDTVVTGVPRGPFCMMGVCYDCLVVVDGRANQQACMTAVRDGMIVMRQQGAREVLE